MSTASLAGRPFRINPTSVSWDYTVKTSERSTVGGIVVQVYGVDLGDMTVQGTFGVGGWKEQDDFLSQMKEMADRQVSHPEADPPRFFYPGRGWDFAVQLAEYTEVGSDQAVVASNENFSPTWSLRLFIVADNSPVKGVQDAAVLQYINRISAGLGWQQTRYNGPITDSEVQSYVTEHNATTVQDLLQKAGGGN